MSEWRKDLLRSLVPANGPHYNLWAVPEYGDFMRNIFSDYWWRGRQLTTGADRPPEVCRCRTELVDGGSQYGVAHIRDPRCTIHPGELSRSPIAARPPACSCWYGLRHVAGVAGTHQLGAYRNGWRRGVYAFRIDPRCVHHGNGSAVERTGWRADYVIVDEWPAWSTLDDAERRGE